MPYIEPKRRGNFDGPLNQLATFVSNGGDLNYCFSMLCKHFIDCFGESYKNYAECISALEAAKLEFYRRRVAPYEDTKIEENGDL